MNSILADQFTIRSKIVVFPSRSGKKMVGFLDERLDLGETSATGVSPFVVMAPKYGQSKKNNLQIGYTFAQNGFRVLRFDHTNHVGESEGDIVNYTLPGAVDDIFAAIDFLETQYGAQNVILQANSMSARCAIRAARVDPRISRLICLVGIIDFRYSITLICQKDIVDVYMDGGVQGVGDILGHDVDIDQFLRTSVESNMHDGSGTRDDLAAAHCDVFMFAAEKDAWVDLKQLEEMVADLDRVQVRRVTGVMHELMENPGAALNTVSEAVFVAKHGRFPEGNEVDSIQQPDKAGIFRQNKIERERLRAVAPPRETEADFWRSYLDKYKMLESVGAYKDYLALINDCLGPPVEGSVYFDCGCGNGMFGAWCLRDLIRQRSIDWRVPATYFGLDLTGRGLSEAAKRHSMIANEEVRNGRENLNMIYFRFDLDDLGGKGGKLLPLADNSVDAICCSLLISYLKDPLPLVAELYRVLKPGGRVVVSSMKPFCDLSLIYKGYLNEAEGSEAIEAARELLSAAGVIQMKEDEGHYVFYGEDELVQLLKRGGFKRPQFFRSFGDQANLATAFK